MENENKNTWPILIIQLYTTKLMETQKGRLMFVYTYNEI